ncbi:MAG TPA: hypothetical protein VEK74_06935 [Burkholderiaceae bacterium]|nr:hypothetical protein [Burkholderiaceae bacterium]
MSPKGLTIVAAVASSVLWATGAAATTCTGTCLEIGLGATPTSDVVAGPTNGSVTFSSTGVAGFSQVTVTGTGNPPLSLPALLDTTNINVTASGSGTQTLDVWITETGLTSPTGTTVPFLSGLDLNGDSSPGITVTENTYLDLGNGAFATTTQLASQVLNPNGSMVVLQAGNTGSGPYSITAEYIVTLNSGQNADGTIDISVAPLPGALVLFGSVLFGGLGISSLRKRRRGPASVMA